MDNMTREMMVEEHEAFRLKAIKDRIAEASAREHAAAMDKHRAMADLAALEGREWDRQYNEAFVAAQTHQAGGHERFWKLCHTRDAKLILAGGAVLTDFAPFERPGIEREVEWLKAANAAELNGDTSGPIPEGSLDKEG